MMPRLINFSDKEVLRWCDAFLNPSDNLVANERGQWKGGEVLRFPSAATATSYSWIITLEFKMKRHG